MNQLNVPILFLIFNRPDTTKRVFGEIKKARPKKLFIAADGPRKDWGDDIEKCKKAREIVNDVDWPCEIKTFFHTDNLGCKIGVATAIDWFFKNVEKGIILEDDCLPDQSFFTFCEKLLEKYKDEEKVAMISGYNIAGSLDSKSSYLFSKYGHIWGWATWRRAWGLYDISMKKWGVDHNRQKIKQSINDNSMWNYKRGLYEQVYLNKKDTWDYQWEFCRLLSGQLSIVPSVNLVENIGFGTDATHTKATESPLLIPSRKLDLPLVFNPGPLAPDKRYDHLLRPQTSAIKTYLNLAKGRAIITVKKLMPPFIYELCKNILIGKKRYSPKWNTLTYGLMSGIKIFFDPSGSWQKKMVSGIYDTFIFNAIKTKKPSGKVIFDIGAHIGFHSLYFARLIGEDGKVYSFEPNSANFKRAELIFNENDDVKKRITIFNIAVSDKSETVEFNLNNDIESGRSSGNFIEKADTFWNKDMYAEKGFVKAKTRSIPIDSFKEELGINDSPDFIKIDVEGAEYLVLLGALKTLLAKKPVLFIEIHSMENMFNVVSLLHSLKYDMKILKKESNGVCFIEADPN